MIHHMTTPQKQMPSVSFGIALGRLLRTIREEAHISQEKLARRLDMSRETVRRIEFGYGTTTDTVQRYLEELGASAEDLLRFPATPPYPRGKRAGPRHLRAVAHTETRSGGSLSPAGSAKGLGTTAVVSRARAGSASAERARTSSLAGRR